jgi:shikimate 5-dehydrogenase
MPHNYSLNEQVDVKSYLPLIQSDSLSTFAGASVTIPHKESIMQYLDEIRHPADIIGAINTISVESIDLTEHFRSKQKLVGYNTDWLGIYNPIFAKLTQVWGKNGWRQQDPGSSNSNETGLVVGAGKLYIINQMKFSNSMK